MSSLEPKILISDDDANLVTALSRFARHAGFEVTEDTESEVVALAKRVHPDLILLDLRQKVDGRDLLASLKRDPETRDIKVVVLSGVEDQFTRRTCLELGAFDYETKPFDPSIGRKLIRLVAMAEEAAAPESVH